MKKVRFVCLFLLILTLVAMAVNLFAVSLPDWVVRTVGVVMRFDLLKGHRPPPQRYVLKNDQPYNEGKRHH